MLWIDRYGWGWIIQVDEAHEGNRIDGGENNEGEVNEDNDGSLGSFREICHSFLFGSPPSEDFTLYITLLGCFQPPPRK